MTNFGYIDNKTDIIPVVRDLLDEITLLTDNLVVETTGAATSVTNANTTIANANALIATAQADVATAQAGSSAVTDAVAAADLDLAAVDGTNASTAAALAATDADATTLASNVATLETDANTQASTMAALIVQADAAAASVVPVETDAATLNAQSIALETQITRDLQFSYGGTPGGQVIAKPGGVNTYAEFLNITPLSGNLPFASNALTLTADRVYRITLNLDAVMDLAGYYVLFSIVDANSTRYGVTFFFRDGYYTDTEGYLSANSLSILYDTAGKSGNQLVIRFRASVDFGSSAANLTVGSNSWYFVQEIYRY